MDNRLSDSLSPRVKDIRSLSDEKLGPNERPACQNCLMLAKGATDSDKDNIHTVRFL